MNKPCTIGALASSFALTYPAHAAQLDFPVRPVRIVVPYLPGGGVDFTMRTLSQRLSAGLGRPVVVDNRAGGATNIAAEMVARSAPDGYTLFVGGDANTVNMSLYKRLSYDIVKDFAPISIVSTAPLFLVVHPSLPAKSVKELIALAKAQGQMLSFASAGIAGTTHLAAELFKTMAGVDMVHVPYKGGGGAVVDLLAGYVPIYFGAMPSTLPHVKAGRLRGLAVTSAKRTQSAPDFPTVAEAGLPGYEQSTWQGLLAPALTPKEVISRIHSEIVPILRLPEVKEALAAQGVDAIGSTPSELAELITSNIAKYRRLVQAAGIRVE